MVDCSICLEEVLSPPPESQCTNKKCDARYHEECLKEWRERKLQIPETGQQPPPVPCPACRSPLEIKPTDVSKYEPVDYSDMIPDDADNIGALILGPGNFIMHDVSASREMQLVMTLFTLGMRSRTQNNHTPQRRPIDLPNRVNRPSIVPNRLESCICKQCQNHPRFHSMNAMLDHVITHHRRQTLLVKRNNVVHCKTCDAMFTGHGINHRKVISHHQRCHRGLGLRRYIGEEKFH